jgi:excisionase family DNA binding protein
MLATTMEMTSDVSLKDVKWLADFLGVSKSWVYQACAAGRLPVVRVGALLRFNPAVIASWVKGESVGKSVRLPTCR